MLMGVFVKTRAMLLAVLMVITTIAACTDGWESNAEGDRPFMEFEISQMSSRTIGSEEYWDVTLKLWRVTPDGKTMNWSMVYMDVSIKTGPYSEKKVVYFEQMTPDNPSSYSSTEPVSVEGWYIDDGGKDMVSVGDKLKITGMNRSFEEGSIYLQYGDPRDWFGMDWVGSGDLPEVFQAMESTEDDPEKNNTVLILFIIMIIIIVVVAGVAIVMKRRNNVSAPQHPGFPPPS
jgi:hypothetical protein